ncbi:hypothetical protein RESH_02706 [Rhodopirellula europaea SH398]|uniref:Uncharacterized protein n=1 Tax=Rhodopirellula europaea SH398 TaxID=1263868 RepID=M5S5B9_9BACT|nr:hypothetical protein RESH_02706 [Rhodopirellula europaea SH398]
MWPSFDTNEKTTIRIPHCNQKVKTAATVATTRGETPDACADLNAA